MLTKSNPTDEGAKRKTKRKYVSCEAPKDNLKKSNITTNEQSEKKPNLKSISGEARQKQLNHQFWP